MDLSLSGKVALVTGGSSGIGRETAIGLAEEGVRVAITSLDYAKALTVEKEIIALGGEALAISGDASDKADIEQVILRVTEHFGQLDILVNNVGSTGRIVEFSELEEEEWLELFQLNVLSGVHFSRLALPWMQRNQWGRIIFLSSERASQPLTLMPHYSVSKSAILTLAKSLANSYGRDGITVNAVSPGAIPTPAWDKGANAEGLTREMLVDKHCPHVLKEGELGSPEDVASLITFLCSEKARWITGSNFRIDGGVCDSIQL